MERVKEETVVSLIRLSVCYLNEGNLLADEFIKMADFLDDNESPRVSHIIRELKCVLEEIDESKTYLITFVSGELYFWTPEDPESPFEETMLVRNASSLIKEYEETKDPKCVVKYLTRSSASKSLLTSVNEVDNYLEGYTQSLFLKCGYSDVRR